jgi:hypothetical protein
MDLYINKLMVFTSSTGTTNIHITSIQPLSEKIKNLQIISCDICNGRKASYDVFIEGIISGIVFLKRYCESCVKTIK